MCHTPNAGILRKSRCIFKVSELKKIEPFSSGREGKGREGKGREGKGREGKGREGKRGVAIQEVPQREAPKTVVIFYCAKTYYLNFPEMSSKSLTACLVKVTVV